MKKLSKLAFKILIFGLAFLFAGNLSASATNTLKIETDANQKSILLSFNVSQNSNVLIQIKDDNGAVLHAEEVVAQNEFAKKFNLAKLPEGTYYLEVSDELKDVVQPIEVFDSNIVLNPSSRAEYYKPVYRFQNKKLDINLLALSNAKINLEIFDFENHLVFSQTFENVNKTFGQRFDLSKLGDGKYTVRITTGNHIYYKNLEVK